MRIQPGAVWQHAYFLARAEAFDNDVGIVDVRGAGIGPQYGVKNPERRRLTRTVRPEEAGNLAVGRGEADSLHSPNLAKGLVQLVDADQGSGPA